jgi:hypothetical protein
VAEVLYAKAQGADFIKIIGDVPLEAYFVLLRTARANGLRGGACRQRESASRLGLRAAQHRDLFGASRDAAISPTPRAHSAPHGA